MRMLAGLVGVLILATAKASVAVQARRSRVLKVSLRSEPVLKQVHVDRRSS